MARVLLVDDEPLYLRFLGREARRAGHEVETASSGSEGVAAGLRFRPDVLVVDWMLQDSLRGVDVAEALGAELPRLLTIVITGYPSLDLEKRKAGARIVEVLEKPVSFEVVRAALSRAVALCGAAP